MRKFAITAFALFYLLFILSASAEHAELWAQKEAVSLAQQSAQHAHGFGKTGKPDTHISQTKLLEAGFVVELPRQASVKPVLSERQSRREIQVFAASRTARSDSSRAPPSVS